MKRKPKEWFDKNERLNANYTIQIGDRLYVNGSNDVWIVVEIIEGYNIEDHGSILLRKEQIVPSNYIPLGEVDNNTYLHPVYFGWQRWARIIHPSSEQVMAGVICTSPYKNWQEWLNSEEGKRVVGV
jgi:hypothetical protein